MEKLTIAHKGTETTFLILQRNQKARKEAANKITGMTMSDLNAKKPRRKKYKEHPKCQVIKV